MTNNNEKTKTVQVKKSDLREAYEFNRKAPEYKNRQTAVFRVWEDKEKADLHYNQEGNFYPKNAGPKAEIHPAQIVEESKGWTYPVLSETRTLVAEEYPEMDKDSKEYREKVSEWHDEAENLAWESCDFKEEIEMSEHLELEKIKVEITEESDQ